MEKFKFSYFSYKIFPQISGCSKLIVSTENHCNIACVEISTKLCFIFSSERTFVSERNEASGCASASIHSRTLTQDDVSNQLESFLQYKHVM